MPDLEQLEWPFRSKPERPPVILVNGTPDFRKNTLVAPPESEDIRLMAELQPLELPLPENPVTRWEPITSSGALRGTLKSWARMSLC
jgi:hypothetical protein